jgi:hypothetical protein
MLRDYRHLQLGSYVFGSAVLVINPSGTMIENNRTLPQYMGGVLCEACDSCYRLVFLR